MSKLPASVVSVRRAFEEARPADISSRALEAALRWLDKHDPLASDRDGDSLVVLIEDELDFRDSGEG